MALCEGRFYARIESQRRKPMENYAEVYQKLLSGEMAPVEVEVQFLFEMASQFAAAGQYDKKAEIYGWVLGHPRATDDEVIRVQTYQCDLKRRKGNPEEALAELLALTPPLDSMALCEWLQAIGQCHLMMGDVQEALVVQRQIIALFSRGQIPVHRQLYHVETILAMKQRAGEADEELERFFQLYKQLLDDPSLEGAIKQRARAMLESLRGSAELQKGNFKAAARYYQRYANIAPAARNKVVAAVQFLYCCWQLYPYDHSMEVQLAKAFFQNHRGELQPTDIAALRTEYDFVMKKLGLSE